MSYHVIEAIGNFWDFVEECEIDGTEAERVKEIYKKYLLSMSSRNADIPMKMVMRW